MIPAELHAAWRKPLPCRVSLGGAGGVAGFVDALAFALRDFFPDFLAPAPALLSKSLIEYAEGSTRRTASPMRSRARAALPARWTNTETELGSIH